MPTEPILRPDIHLGVGEQRYLRLKGLKRYALGNENVIKTLPLPANSPELGAETTPLLLKGISPGSTDLWVWKTDGQTEVRAIRVYADDSKKKEAEDPTLKRLQQALDHLQEVEVIPAEKGVILRGEILSLKEAETVAAVQRGFPQWVINETRLSPAPLRALERPIQNWLNTHPERSRLTLRKEGDRLILQGSIENTRTRQGLEADIKSRFPILELQLDSLPDTARTVHFRVFLLELKRNRFGSLGLSWPALQEGAFRVTRWGIEEALQLDLLLQSMEGDGSARVLSNPELSVRAPGEAELFAGGEIPIETRNRFGSNVTFRPYGLSLKLNVTYSTADQVRLDIATEVSHLDVSIGSGDLPGFQTNRMRTQVDARYSQPLLLSGLLQHGVRENARGLPFLRQIPVLGSLFGSEDYLRERSELVAILLPLIRPPKAPLDNIQRLTPVGPVPPPRSWLSAEQMISLRASQEWPWNALEEETRP
jgi:pilus assembly protein CpaC